MTIQATSRRFGAALVAAAMAVSMPAGAAFAAAPSAPLKLEAPSELVTPVRGCHRNTRRHYVPEVGRTMRHHHRGPRCRPIRDGRRGDRFERRGRRDCHRRADRHFLPEFGRSVVHRHVGPRCRVVPLRRDRDFRGRHRGRNCIQFGPVRYCEG